MGKGAFCKMFNVGGKAMLAFVHRLMKIAVLPHK